MSLDERYRPLLPEIVRREGWKLALLLALVAGLYAPVIPQLVREWIDDPNYSHGFLVPAVSAWFLWRRRGELAETEINPDRWGIPFLLVALGLLVLGWVGTEYFTQRVSLILLLGALVLFLFGREVLSMAALPLGYLLFMVPIPYILYDAVAFPLKLFVAAASVRVLKIMGVVVWREGNVILFPNAVFEVADACSGIRSLLSLLALAVAYAFVAHRRPAARAILIAAALPIALLTNALRVVGTGILAQYWGARAAEGFFHEFAGLAVFALALLLLLLTGEVLRRRMP